MRMRGRLQKLYGAENIEQLGDRLYAILGRYGVESQSRDVLPKWSQEDAVLITYADMLSRVGESPLNTMERFVRRRLRHAINTVHLLPFYPSSSDGGFSVVDYRQVDEECGTWDDVQALHEKGQVELMFDLVLNHCSRKSDWFRSFVNGIAPEKNYFQVEDPKADWSKVIRPRVTPLFHETETSEGPQSVWTTFSADQVDLNWQEPDVLFEFVDILLGYISRGARIVRLDAIAFLWKEVGTTCLHQENTHEVVKLMRDIVIAVAPHVILLTETNVDHLSNISYFGEGDEAHMVYQFTLPPLLLHGLLRGDSKLLQQWVSGLERLPEGCTFFNFTASHDGIGLRGLEGWVEGEELKWLVAQAEERGSRLGKRNLPGGGTAVYELNINYRSALSVPGDEELGARRFICSQAIMLALQGVPGVYFHSLVGSESWTDGPDREGGENRDINRERLTLKELEEQLDDPEHEAGWIHNVYCSMLRTRRYCEAFDPDVPQRVIPSEGGLFLLAREPENGHPVLCCSNFTDQNGEISSKTLQEFFGEGVKVKNILNGGELKSTENSLKLQPYGTAWLTI